MDLFMTSKKFSVAEIDEKVDKLDKHLKSIDKQLKKASYTKEGQITKKKPWNTCGISKLLSVSPTNIS